MGPFEKLMLINGDFFCTESDPALREQMAFELFLYSKVCKWMDAAGIEKSQRALLAAEMKKDFTKMRSYNHSYAFLRTILQCLSCRIFGQALSVSATVANVSLGFFDRAADLLSNSLGV